MRVEGASQRATAGFNGSSDPTATEGTGSYTTDALTVGSKAPQSMKDTVQSVSVLTAQKMRDQNIVSFNQAMAQLPGVTMVQSNSQTELFYSRGFQVTSVQVDGGAPLFAGSMASLQRYATQIDMSQYDHVELLRGADSFNMYGSPSGSVNLVRKRPLDHAQVSLEMETGSWNNYRAVLDATRPLALDGALRGRVVMTYQDKGLLLRHRPRQPLADLRHSRVRPHTVDRGERRLQLHEADLRSLVLRIAALRRRRRSETSEKHLSVLSWNQWNIESRQPFAQLEQRFGENWHLKLNLTQDSQDDVRTQGSVAGAVNRFTNAGQPCRAARRDIAQRPAFGGGDAVRRVRRSGSAAGGAHGRQLRPVRLVGNGGLLFDDQLNLCAFPRRAGGSSAGRRLPFQSIR
ncbi:MAG: TonB-dependent receptor plug domain-containing protein [Gammaproteobacteria bacterium]